MIFKIFKIHALQRLQAPQRATMTSIFLDHDTSISHFVHKRNIRSKFLIRFNSSIFCSNMKSIRIASAG